MALTGIIHEAHSEDEQVSSDQCFQGARKRLMGGAAEARVANPAKSEELARLPSKPARQATRPQHLSQENHAAVGGQHTAGKSGTDFSAGTGWQCEHG